jgi:hypothetical protein
MNNTRRAEGEVGMFILAVIGLFMLSVLVGGCMYVQPKYSVYQKELEGQAELIKAESTRKIAVLEAQAKMDSSKLLAQAEVERAKGVAQANQIIGESLKGNEDYLHYLWIQNLHEGRNDVIYIPTETGLPIMEAGRLGNRKSVEAERK